MIDWGVSLPFTLPHGIVAIERSDEDGHEYFTLAAYITHHRRKYMKIASLRLFNDGTIELDRLPRPRTRFGEDAWKRICEHITGLPYIDTRSVLVEPNRSTQAP